eukprot:CAMPEP_0181299032 /NCGR_PEP_ID=MMETSP1101-20121128/6115_1 /TAXON_ID=46948 /ORGANISM="Rhodomonas abbreviata, Strain Caron Lab Isolate" /LENGTH=84 /DNA_ID=CAMNT_0023404125 /DNA_START=69 /DNA_END=323 /DNA_ORIENTATION=+
MQKQPTDWKTREEEEKRGNTQDEAVRCNLTTTKPKSLRLPLSHKNVQRHLGTHEVNRRCDYELQEQCEGGGGAQVSMGPESLPR